MIDNAAHGQGWQFRVSFGGASAGQPYDADGNYVSGLSNFTNDYGSVIVNYPSETATYRIDGYKWNDGFKYAHELSQPAGFHFLGRAIETPVPDTFVVLTEVLPVSGGDRSVFLHFRRFNISGLNGDVLYRQTLVYGTAGANAYAKTLLPMPNGDYIVLGSVETSANPGNRDILLARVSAQGDLLWSNVYPGADSETAVKIVAGANGDLHILKTVLPAGQAWLMNVDANGTLINAFNLSGTSVDTAADMTATADGNLVLTGRTQAGQMFLQKASPGGATLWRHEFATPDQNLVPYGLLEDPPGDLVVICTRTNLLSNEKDGLLMKFDAVGSPVWERRIGRDNRPEELTKIRLCPDGGYFLGGWVFDQIIHSYVVKTDVNGIVKPARILGNVFRDFDLDCGNTAGDLPLENRIVRAYRDSAHVYYGASDANGDYYIECDTGDYVLSLILPNALWDACANHLPISLGYLDTAVVDFALQAVIECPFMTVEHSLFRARPCDTTLLSLDYCNLGTITADGAYLEVTLDSNLTYLGATIPPSSIVGNLLTFPLGNVASADCGHLDIEVAVNCGVEIGQIVCTEAYIFPDTICLPVDPVWSGAFVEATATCSGDSVHFILKNTGNVGMTAPLEYIVIEDAVLLHSGGFQLAPGETMEVNVPATGATWHLMAGQEPGAPGNSVPVVAIEGCVSGGGAVSTGFFNQFAQNDAVLPVSLYCTEVVNSFDPNDKQAFPTGFGVENSIFANTDIEYMIRFQNTGTDTAFRVILLDTLSAFLDPATFQPGASSHPYQLSLSENGVLQFTFQPIALPHSSVDEPGSNGFVSFRIAQKPDNPVGTRIENRAGIYFDFNLPVITNTVFHTVHAPWLKLVDVNQPDTAPKITFQAFPNPFAEQVTVRIEGAESRDAVLRLVSIDGKLLREVPFQQNQLMLDRKGLPAGMYFFSVVAEGRILGSGRLVAE